MNFYLLIFLTISMIYYFDSFFKDENNSIIVFRWKILISTFIFFLLTLTLGFRDALGSDYGSYFLDFIYMEEYFSDTGTFKTQSLDLVYEYLSFFIILLNLPFDYLSILISIIIIFSLLFFANQEREPLLIILIFLSYYFLVLGMGYLRQGLSISFLLFFIHFWRNEKIFLSLIFLILAVLSHKFAIVSSFIIFFRPKGNLFYFNKYFYLILMIILAVLFYKIFQFKNISEYFDVYSQEHSSGSYYRTLAGAICATLFFSKQSFFKKRSDYRYLYISSSILIFLFPVSFFYSTISDRILAYFLPCILIILSTIPIVFKKLRPSLIKCLLVGILFSHLLLWTNYSNQSDLYTPYRMIDFPGAKESPYKYMIRYCC